MEIICTKLSSKGTLPKKYTCKDSNINPPLQFLQIPERTKSLILIFEDRDAKPVPWVHWLIFNIPPTVTVVKEGQIPQGGIEGLANNHTFGYEGPCPKYFKGVHHYQFLLLALDTILSLPKNSDKKAVLKKTKNHILDSTELIVVQQGEQK